MENMSGLSEVHDNNMKTDKNNAKTGKLQPKPKEQVLEELEELRKRLGLHNADGTMTDTKNIIKQAGPLSDLFLEMKKKERQ